MAGITIIGSGRYAPGVPVTNHDLSRVMDTNDEWIRQRTGIEQRHYAPDGTGASDLATEAAKRALENADLRPADVDYIIFATMTPDYIFPGSGGLLGAKLGIPGVPALDIRQQCCAMPFGLQVADGLVASGAARTVLLVGAEAHAGFMPWHDWDRLSDPNAGPVVREAENDEDATADRKAQADYDRATRHRGLAILFGDGAGALVLRRSETEGSGLIGTKVHSDGRDAESIFIDGGGFRRRPYWTPGMFEREEHIPRMAGRDLFKKAATRLPQVIRELCAEHEVRLEDVDWFIAHQANDRINGAVQQALGMPKERFPSNIARYGNTSGATIPILVDEMRADGRLKEGQLVCFVALGSGLHWGASLMRL